VQPGTFILGFTATSGLGETVYDASKGEIAVDETPENYVNSAGTSFRASTNGRTAHQIGAAAAGGRASSGASSTADSGARPCARLTWYGDFVVYGRHERALS
jgi:hypothetical protein